MRTWDLGLLLLSSGAVAQTHTDCDPTKVDCPSDKGIKEAQYSVDFTQGESPDWAIPGGGATYDQNGVGFTISAAGQAPTMQSDFYMFFGSVSAIVRAAPGTGIVSCVILQSDCLDEIDWEWLGGDAAQVQTNYFRKGNTATYDRGSYESVADNQATFHNYTIEWTAELTRWIIDGNEVRVLNYADANGGSNYPQTPMRIKLGNWNAAGTGNQGTIDWAGGQPDFAAAPFTMFVERIDIVNQHPAASYSYGDKSGSWQSIVISDQDVEAPGNDSSDNKPIPQESSLTDDSENLLKAGDDANATTTASSATSSTSTTVSTHVQAISTANSTANSTATTTGVSETIQPVGSDRNLGARFGPTTGVLVGVLSFVVFFF